VSHILKELGVEKKKYILQVTRFEPENHPLLTLQAFNILDTEFKCVLVGGANFRSPYLEQIENEERKNNKIVLPGFIYHKEKLEIILKHAYFYIHGNSVGGTNPALLQAMAAGRPVISLNCQFNRDTLGGHGYFYEKNIESLGEQIQYVFNNNEEAEKKAQTALERIKTVYTWEKVTNAYEELFTSITVNSSEK
jgi:glycosyltransferase involved in cell wall biosynthesis